jgi:hypothetical protein
MVHVQVPRNRADRPLLDMVQTEDLPLDFVADHHAGLPTTSPPGARITAATEEAVPGVAATRMTAEAAPGSGTGMRPSGRTQVSIVFMMRGSAPRHRFNRDRRCGWRCMRYGICGATAAVPIPPLPCGVVPSPDLALPVAPLRRPADLPPTLHRAAARAVLVAAIAPRADRDPSPAAGASEHSMAVHGGDRSPSRTGREGARCATLRQADVAFTRAVC